MESKKNSWGAALSLLFIPLLIISGIFWYLSTNTTDRVEYYDIVKYFDEGKVTEYSLNLRSGKLTYVLEGEKEKRIYTVPNVNLFIKDVHDKVREQNTENAENPVKMDYIKGASTSVWMSVLPNILLMALVIAFLVFVTKKMNQTMSNETDRSMNFGKARIKAGVDEKRKTTFADVAGVDEEKEELSEIVEFLKDPNKFSDLGARIPKGVLLVGPPGTGKTLLARAVAGEADVPFLSISGSDFVEMYVGVGASRVRDLFESAKKNAPAIIFIDEIDAVGRHRGAGMGGGHDEREQTLNQLLVEMDGFGTNEGVIIIAATNRPDILDPALLRPGRFDRQVTVHYPDIKGREEILKVHAKGKPLAPDVELDKIARSTAGFTGADLENLLNEAALLAARRGLYAITMEEIAEATIKVVVGTEKKSRKISDKEKKLTAYHEAGHALTTFYIEGMDPVHQISIIPRGMAGGYTMSIPAEDKSYMAKSDMLNEIVTLLGGRVAEAVVLGDISTGASNDIERATDIARKMITKYGMSNILGPISYGSGNQEVFLGKDYSHVRNYSESTAAEIDSEINKIIIDAYERAEDILRSNIDKLHRVSNYLIEYEKIDGDLFEKLMTTDEDYDLSGKIKNKDSKSNSKPDNTGEVSGDLESDSDLKNNDSNSKSNENESEKTQEVSEVENTPDPFDSALPRTDTNEKTLQETQERETKIKSDLTDNIADKNNSKSVKLEETELFEETIDEETAKENAKKEISDESNKNIDENPNKDLQENLEEFSNPYSDVADELKELSINSFLSYEQNDRKLATGEEKIKNLSDSIDEENSNALPDVDIENMADVLSEYLQDDDEGIELTENDEIYELYELLKATRDFDEKESSSNDEEDNQKK